VNRKLIHRGAAAVVVTSLVALVLLGSSVRSDTTNLQSLDEHRWWIDSRVIQYRFKHRIWFDFAPRVRLMKIETALNFLYLGAACAVVAIVLLALRRRQAALLFVSALLSGAVASVVLKPLFGRAIETALGDLTYTFPSGHMSLLSGVVVALVLLTRRRGARALAAIAGVIVLSLYGTLLSLTGSHFVTDCIGGVLTGIAVVVGTQQLTNRFFTPTS
jgi:membrane-associated phospholipid phosphatase